MIIPHTVHIYKEKLEKKTKHSQLRNPQACLSIKEKHLKGNRKTKPTSQSTDKNPKTTQTQNKPNQTKAKNQYIPNSPTKPSDTQTN